MYDISINKICSERKNKRIMKALGDSGKRFWQTHTYTHIYTPTHTQTNRETISSLSYREREIEAEKVIQALGSCSINIDAIVICLLFKRKLCLAA